MAFPVNPYADMSQFVPAGPNGIPIPRSLAPTFGIVEPQAPIVPPEPLPPPVPLPVPAAPPANSNAAALFHAGAESLRPPPVGDGTLSPFPAPTPEPARKPGVSDKD